MSTMSSSTSPLAIIPLETMTFNVPPLPLLCLFALSVIPYDLKHCHHCTVHYLMLIVIPTVYYSLSIEQDQLYI